MAIKDVQYRYRQLGRLRLGDVDETNGKTRPKRLDTWRLTSPSMDLLKKAEAAWGGEVQEWEGAPTEGTQYELTTEVAALPVLVPPQDIDSQQFYELWSTGGIKRRCDGETDFISGRSCPCAVKDTRQCKLTTQLLVMLPQLPDIGVWRLVTRGWNAGAELPMTVNLLLQVASKHTWPEATLAIESRTSKTEGPKGPETHHFVVPVLRLPFALSELLAQIDQAHEVTAGPRGRVPITGRKPELPADASFSDERDPDWGEETQLPAAGGVSEVPVDEEGAGDSGVEGEVERDPASSSQSVGGSSEADGEVAETSAILATDPAEGPPAIAPDGPPSDLLVERAVAHFGSASAALRRAKAYHEKQGVKLRAALFKDLTHGELQATLEDALA